MARRLLWAVTALCFLVGLMAVPVVDDDDGVPAGEAPGARSLEGDAPAPPDPAVVLDDASASASASGAGPTGADAPVAGEAAVPTTTTLPPPPPSTTLPPAPAELGAPVDPGPPVAPRPGVYRYRTTGGPEGDGESTSRVEQRGRTGDEVRLAVTSAGGDVTTTSDVVWRPDGVRTVHSSLSFGDRRGECDWEPDVVDAVFPLQARATWSTETRCAVTGLSPTPIVLQRTSSARVLELRRHQVAGRTVDVWAIERTERLTGGGMSEEVIVVALFSPAHGVDVDLRGTRSGQEYRRELLSLDATPV